MNRNNYFKAGRRCLFPLILGFFSSTDMSAQCEMPLTVPVSSTISTCAANGTITVGTVSGGSGDYLEYAVYDAANLMEVKPWQNENFFDNMTGGNYTLRTRYVCALGYSPVHTQSVNVSGTYVNPSIADIVVDHQAICNDGQITVTAVNGTLPYSYALVPSLSVAEPVSIGDYVSVPQSSNVFDDLSSGTHYVRVYDACGSYVTNSIVLRPLDSFQIFDTHSFKFQYRPCDTIVGRIRVNYPYLYLGDYGTNARKLWITYPDGSTDTVNDDWTPSFTDDFYIPMSKFGSLSGTGAFPDNVEDSWPKTFRIGLTDVCDIVHYKDFVVEKPAYLINWQREVSSSCDIVNYVFSINQISGGTSYWYGDFPPVLMSHTATYSLDGGITWLLVMPNGTYSQSISLNPGDPFEACLAWCGDTACYTGTIPVLDLWANVFEDSRLGCKENTGLFFSVSDGIAPVLVNMVSGPAGVVWTEDTLEVSPYHQYPEQALNLPVGEYIFSFTDACGLVKYDTIDTRYIYTPTDFSYSFPCGSSNMVIDISNYLEIRNFNYSYAGYMVDSFEIEDLISMSAVYTAEIYTSGGTLVTSFPYYNVGSSITIDATTILGLANGDYYIQIKMVAPWGLTADTWDCVIADLPWTKTDNLINLNRTVSVSSCPGMPSTGSVIGITDGGFGTLTYNLYEGSFAAENLVAGPQVSNIFNGLNSGSTYVLAVADECGRGTQTTVSFGSTSLPVYNDAGGIMPCPGTSLRLFVNNMDGVEYQWYKNDVPILGAVYSEHIVSGISDVDSGEYKVELTIGSCTIFLASFVLNPDDCGNPLNVNWQYFDAFSKRDKVLLSWGTASENNNKGFHIEKSSDGISWSTIGYVASKAIGGNSAASIDYAYVDADPALGLNIYRLKQMDHSGMYEYSDIRTVWFETGVETPVSLHPNPANDYVRITGLQGGESISIIDVTGRQIIEEKADELSFSIDVRNLSEGLYFIKIRNSKGQIVSHKLVKRK